MEGVTDLFIKALDDDDNNALTDFYYTSNVSIDFNKVFSHVESREILNPSMIHLLGWMCYEGLGGNKKDEKKAIVLYKQAAAAGNPFAMTKLGNYFLNVLSFDEVETNIKKAFEYFTKAAKRDDKRAMEKLADLYLTTNEQEKAVKWLLRSDQKQKFLTGGLKVNPICCHFNKVTTKIKRMKEEIFKFERMIEEMELRPPNSPEIVFEIVFEEIKVVEVVNTNNLLDLLEHDDSDKLGNIYRNCHNFRNIINWEKVVTHFKDKKNLNGNILNILGYIYGQSMDGVIGSSLKAARFYQQSCDAGNVFGMNNLALCYMRGHGVQQNTYKGRKLFQTTLGMNCINAISSATPSFIIFGQDKHIHTSKTKRYFNMIIELYQKGVENGDAYAIEKLGDCYYLGDAVDIDIKKAFDLYKSSAKKGSRSAQSFVGRWYCSGNGIDKNMKKGIKLCLKSYTFYTLQKYQSETYEVCRALETEYHTLKNKRKNLQIKFEKLTETPTKSGGTIFHDTKKHFFDSQK
ncbi:MAG: hypothetical protein DRI46_10645 [Chloroflexi bacterium]|nr:MAG: hypothetical protein DRI46_10645 [Chloroflexota bacterium]